MSWGKKTLRMLPELQQIHFFLELLIFESKQLSEICGTDEETNFPQVTRIIAEACALLFTVIMDSSLMLSLILLQGAPGKPGEIGSKGERVGWRILLVISLR